jgi:hypothetical protein
MSTTRAALLLALAAASVSSAPSAFAAGTYDQPYAIVESADRSETRKEFPAAITKIDGNSTDSPRRPAAVEPGKHQVTIRYETGKVTQSPEEMTRTLDMDLEPCTRYRIAARRTTGTSWEPQVYHEKIGECTRKFKQAK